MVRLSLISRVSLPSFTFKTRRRWTRSFSARASGERALLIRSQNESLRASWPTLGEYVLVKLPDEIVSMRSPGTGTALGVEMGGRVLPPML